jgi:hypothetical protein
MSSEIAMNIACLGSREIPPEIACACREMGMCLAQAGYTVVTGATPGTLEQDEWAGWADGAFASGAYYANPASLVACLPWRHFPRGSGGPPAGVAAEYAEEHPEWAEAARSFWDAEQAGEAGPWAAVRRATRLRHTRNAGVILQARLVLAWPHGEAEETRVAMRFAAWRGVPLIDLSVSPWREVLTALCVTMKNQGGEWILQ